LYKGVSSLVAGAKVLYQGFPIRNHVNTLDQVFGKPMNVGGGCDEVLITSLGVDE
jgi:hypothetical protein